MLGGGGSSKDWYDFFVSKLSQTRSAYSCSEDSNTFLIEHILSPSCPIPTIHTPSRPHTTPNSYSSPKTTCLVF